MKFLFHICKWLLQNGKEVFPRVLQFIRSGENAIEMGKFFEYLEYEECYELLRRNKMSIHTDTGNIFVDNINSGEIFLILLLLKKITVRNCCK